LDAPADPVHQSEDALFGVAALNRQGVQLTPPF
jgi:hypothetical protein